LGFAAKRNFGGTTKWGSLVVVVGVGCGKKERERTDTCSTRQNVGKVIKNVVLLTWVKGDHAMWSRSK